MKNLWSLQVGEVVVAEELSKRLPKNYQVFIPLNNQLRDIDLILSNLDKKNYVTIQVKESREYTLGEANGWFTVSEDKLIKSKIDVDYYVFLLYTARQTKTKYENHTEFIIVPSKILKERSKQKKSVKGRFHYYFHIKDGKAFEVRESKKEPVDYSKYLNNFDQLM